MKFYYANTREKSSRGLRHDACFEGHAQDVVHDFFEGSGVIPGLVGGHPLSATSEDGKMIGLSYDRIENGKKQHFYFRMSACSAGKNPIGNLTTTVSFLEHPIREKIRGDRLPASAYLGAGFELNDSISSPPARPLPKFSLRADYEKAFGARDLPWAGLNLNLTNKKDAFIFAVLLQKYFYENMANQNPAQADDNFIAARNTARYWCHMPWQNQGPTGREAVHGLTRERNLGASLTMSSFRSPAPGTDWGVSYYNAVACGSIDRVFGNQNAPKAPNFENAKFDDGAVAVKILFTTADFPQIHNAFTWFGNVSPVGDNARSIQTLRHIQMDIAVKDSSIKGANQDTSGWIMLTYYFDENYDFAKEYAKAVGGPSPLASLSRIPSAILKMRPMGMQTGMGMNQSMIFQNAETNGFEGRLNGPADNPKTSCLSCHSTAGTQVPMSPGFMSDESYLANKNGSLDFSQQFNLAKQNVETVDPASKAGH